MVINILKDMQLNKIGHLCVASVATIPILYNIKIPTNYFDLNFMNEIVTHINLMTSSWHYYFTSGNVYYPILFLVLLYIGATFPDIDLYFGDNSKRYKTHRQITHSMLLFCMIMYVIFYHLENQYKLYSYMIMYGILTHFIADMLTGTIPIMFYGAYYQPNKIMYRFGIDTFFPFKSKAFDSFKKSIVLIFDKFGLFVFLPYVLMIIVQTIMRLNDKSIF